MASHAPMHIHICAPPSQAVRPHPDSWIAILTFKFLWFSIWKLLNVSVVGGGVLEFDVYQANHQIPVRPHLAHRFSYPQTIEFSIWKLLNLEFQNCYLSWVEPGQVWVWGWWW